MIQKFRNTYFLYLQCISPEDCHLNKLLDSLDEIFEERPNNPLYPEYVEHKNIYVAGVYKTEKKYLKDEVVSIDSNFIQKGASYYIRIIFYHNKPPSIRAYFNGKGWKVDRPKMGFLEFLENLRIDFDALNAKFESHMFKYHA